MTVKTQRIRSAQVLSRSNVWKTKLRVSLFVWDAVAVSLAVVLGVQIRFGDDRNSRVGGLSNLSYNWTAVLLIGAWLLMLVAFGAYNLTRVSVGSHEYRNIARATLSLFGGISIVALLFRIQFARGFLGVAFPLGLALLLIGRNLQRRRLVGRRTRGEFCDRALVVGSPAEVRYVVETINETPVAGYRVVAVATGGQGDTFLLADGSPVAETGSPQSVARAARAADVDAVIVAGQSNTGPDFLRRLSWDLEDSKCGLVLANRVTDIAGPRIHWRPVEGLPLMSVEMPRYAGVRFLGKRAFDVVLGCVLLVLFCPVLLATALAVKLSDGGPVFYRQQRVGVNGTWFKMTKFRSMVTDADGRLAELRKQHDGNDVLFKLKDDPRVTRVGKFIRRYSIDELPQLFDVVRGPMSLVGPRPPLPDEVEAYDTHVHRRLYVKPGMTGPWQVGGRSNLSWEESVRKDLYYVENWSMTGDLLILAQTARAVFSKDGAY